MADNRDLGLAFMAAHPAEAARVLESLPSADAAALFASVAPRDAAGALGAMLPTAAARILSMMQEHDAARLVAESGIQHAVAIMRHVPHALRVRLLAALPAASAITAQMLLGFPEDTVGAWTDTDIVVVAASQSVHAALVQVRSLAQIDPDQVYVVDAEQRLAGCIGLAALLRADPDVLAGSIARPVAASLPAPMPLASARASPQWDRMQSLPVVDRERRLIGVLRRSALTRAQRTRIRREPQAASAGSVTGTLAGGYWRIVAGLSAAVLAGLPRVDRVQPEDA